MAENLTCPVSNTTIDENRVRITAGFVLIAAISYLLVPSPFIPAFLVIDFFLRGFGGGRYSPPGDSPSPAELRHSHISVEEALGV